jgi:lysophospholipase L1-like esterase
VVSASVRGAPLCTMRTNLGGYNMQFRLRALIVTALTVLVGAGTAVVGITSTPSGAAATTPQYYLALGDSLAAGSGATGSSNAYVNRIYTHEAARFPGLVLNNISCGGATTTSMLHSNECGRTVTQTAAAETFLKAHRNHVAFVTIDIGGNDASGCIGAGGVNQSCVNSSAATIQTNLTAILSRLKQAYPGLKLYGMNYYTPQLAFWLTGASGQQVARDSVPYAHTFNAQLTQIYANAGFPTADVATAFDNDNLATTGTYNSVAVPQNVANLCNWTLQCSNNDVHANNIGHGKLADAFTAKIDAAQRPPTITTASLPAGHIGTPYSATLSGTGGTAPYKWKKIGTLPKGLKLTATTGKITGTPKKTPGTFSFQIQLKDSAKPKATATKSFSITIT